MEKDTHSINSPSSFARRIACPGSGQAEAGKPGTTSVYAAEGSAAHWVGEQVLLLDETQCRTNAKALINTETPIINPDTNEKFIVTDEMVEAVDVYIDYCRALTAISDVYGVELKMDLTFLGPDEKGKADFWCITDDGVLEVVDYKHGVGIAVDAIGNVQGMCYWLGVARSHADKSWTKLKVTIVQPRAFHSQGVIRSWTVDREDAEDYYMEYAHAAMLTFESNAPRMPGKHCKFCKAQPCWAMEKKAQEIAKIDFADPVIEPRQVSDLTNDELSDLLVNHKLDIIEDWCTSVRKFAQEQHEQGNHIPGMKIVPTRPVRKFVSDIDPEKFLEKVLPGDKFEKCFTPKKLKTLAQVEKAIGKPLFKEVFATDDPENTKIVMVSTGSTLVPDSDPRSAVKSLATEDFGSTTDLSLFE